MATGQLPAGVEIGGLGKRFVAQMIDGVVPAVVMGVWGAVVASGPSGSTFLVVSIACGVVLLAYGLLLWWMFASRAAGPGMRVMRLQLVGAADGKPIGWGRFFLRQLVLYALAATGIGLIVMAVLLILNPLHQGWHDLAARSVVIAERVKPQVSARTVSSRKPVSSTSMSSTVGLPPHLTGPQGFSGSDDPWDTAAAGAFAPDNGGGTGPIATIPGYGQPQDTQGQPITGYASQQNTYPAQAPATNGYPQAPSTRAGFGSAATDPGFAPQGGQSGFGAPPPAQQGYAQPEQAGYAQAQPQPGFGAPQDQAGYGMPQAGYAPTQAQPAVTGPHDQGGHSPQQVQPAYPGTPDGFGQMNQPSANPAAAMYGYDQGVVQQGPPQGQQYPSSPASVGHPGNPMPAYPQHMPQAQGQAPTEPDGWGQASGPAAPAQPGPWPAAPPVVSPPQTSAPAPDAYSEPTQPITERPANWPQQPPQAQQPQQQFPPQSQPDPGAQGAVPNANAPRPSRAWDPEQSAARAPQVPASAPPARAVMPEMTSVPAEPGEDDLAHTHVARPAARAVGSWAIRLDDGREVTLDGTVLIGRNPVPRSGETVTERVSIGADGRMVSKTHLSVGVDQRGVFVMDRGSTNGTAIASSDGAYEPCAAGDRVRVRDGQVVSFGDHSFVVHRTAG